MLSDVNKPNDVKKIAFHVVPNIFIDSFSEPVRIEIDNNKWNFFPVL